MEIKNLTYRRPSYLMPNRLELIDTIAIHHTSNQNGIEIDTDYHIDHNHWNWNGYAFYIQDGIPYKVRGYEYQNAAIEGHNQHTINIVVKGNYDKGVPSQADMEAVQFVIDEVKKNLPNIKYIKGHGEFNNTSCPGKLFPLKSLKLDKFEYVTKEELENVRLGLIKDNKELERELRNMKNYLNNHFKIRIR